MPKKCTFASAFDVLKTIKRMNDNELITLVNNMKTGDRESFNKIFRRYYSPLMRFCFRFVADEDVSAEIVQDLFVNSAYTYINKERSHNEAHKMMYISETEESDPSDELQSNNLEESYRRILATMPEKRREVFLASRFDGLKYSEIAEKLNISQKTVEAHMGAAIKQLKEGLKEYL